jgi:RHS repeat-associated protein
VNGAAAAFTYNLRFPGQYFDKETNTNYNYFRDYDPATGRYVQSDPIGLKGGINTFEYVQQNPLKYVDPQGLSSEEPDRQFLNPCKNKNINGQVTCDGNGGLQIEICATGCIAECVKVHEEDHKRFFETRFPGSCKDRLKGTNPIPRGTSFYDAIKITQETECRAYAASLQCLRRIQSSKCDCTQKIEDEEAQRKRHHCAAMGW